jgi:hypothetical protein
MWEDPMESALLWQVTLPLAVLRVLAWLLVGFAVTLACGLAGVIAGLALDRRQAPGH